MKKGSIVFHAITEHDTALFTLYRFSLYHWIASLIPFSKSYSGA